MQSTLKMHISDKGLLVYKKKRLCIYTYKSNAKYDYTVVPPLFNALEEIRMIETLAVVHNVLENMRLHIFKHVKSYEYAKKAESTIPPKVTMCCPPLETGARKFNRPIHSKGQRRCQIGLHVLDNDRSYHVMV